MQQSVRVVLVAGLISLPVSAADISVTAGAASISGLQHADTELSAQQQAELRAAEQSRQQIEDIIAFSGLEGLGEQARNLAQQALNDTQAPLGFQYDVVGRLAEQWSPQALQNTLTETLKALDEQQRRTLQDSLHSNRLQNARSKELSAIADQNSRNYQDYIRRLRQQPPAPARIALIKQLDEAMQFSALLSITRHRVYPQLQAVLSDWQPPENWQAGLQRDVTEFLLYVHRTTPNDELQHLLQAYREPVLQQWLAGVKKNLSNRAG